MFIDCFRELGCEVSEETVEELTFRVYRSMQQSTRGYHDLDHVFSVAEWLDPLGRLAAIYHDLVYVQADGGIHPEVRDRLVGTKEAPGPIRIEGPDLRLAAEVSSSIADALIIFGYKTGDIIAPGAGRNEFLSALVAAVDFSNVLPPAQLLSIITCIENTIPFRPVSPDLYGRLLEIDRSKAYGLGPAGVSSLIRRAVAMANSDVKGFAFADIGEFLADTWSLMPETAPALRLIHAYSVRDYRSALESAELLFVSVPPERVFRQWGGYPADDVFQGFVERARRNLTKGAVYIRAKLVGLAILEGIAQLTGGDLPLAYLTGTSPRLGSERDRQLPTFALGLETRPADVDEVIASLLRTGRASQSSFDTAASPTAAFIYDALGAQETERIARLAKLAFTGSIDWHTFLRNLSPAIVSPVLKTAANRAPTRRARLLALEQELFADAGGRRSAA